MAQDHVNLHKTKARLVILFVIAILITISLIGRLGWIQLVRGEEFHQQAWEQWNRSLPTSSSRGAILDRNQELLVGTVSSKTLYAIPPQIQNPKNLAERLKELVPTLDKSTSEIEEILNRETSQVVLANSLDKETAEAIQSLRYTGLRVMNEKERYYPHERLASQLLGFVGTEQGWSGLEYYYDYQLQGQEGVNIFQADGRNQQLPHSMEHYVPGQESLNLQTSIDMTIQYIMERELERGMEQYQPKSAMAVAVNPKTGEVLGMVSKPDYHPGNYQAFNEQQRRLAPIKDTFEPGSTFKLITLAAAIEEDIFDPNEEFYCPGHVEVADHEIGCWRKEGHGDIDFLEVVYDSCNPGFVSLAQELGKEKLFEYIRGFGFGSKAGIDLSGENNGLLFQTENIGPLELATSSFGQGVSVTPIQQVMAIGAIANEGMLFEPRVGQKLINDEGEIVETYDPQKIRRVISPDTANRVSEIMTGIVAEGGAQNAYIDGYEIAGKTGTAQKIGPEGDYVDEDKIVSFIGFAPSGAPEILLYVALDSPKKGPVWGNQIAAPIFRNIMVDILNYKEIPKTQKEMEESEDSEVFNFDMPDLEGMSLEEAEGSLEGKSVSVEVLGEGDIITKQLPKSGSTIRQREKIFLYMESVVNGEKQIVPNLSGRTIREARKILEPLGLRLQGTGSGFIVEQDPSPGEQIERGKRMDVELKASGRSTDQE